MFSEVGDVKASGGTRDENAQLASIEHADPRRMKYTPSTRFEAEENGPISPINRTGLLDFGLRVAYKKKNKNTTKPYRHF